MYKVLTVVAVLALAALGTSIITAVVTNSTTARQSKQIATLTHIQSVERREISALRSRLRPKVRKRTASTSAPRPRSSVSFRQLGQTVRIEGREAAQRGWSADRAGRLRASLTGIAPHHQAGFVNRLEIPGWDALEQ